MSNCFDEQVANTRGIFHCKLHQNRCR